MAKESLEEIEARKLRRAEPPEAGTVRVAYEHDNDLEGWVSYECVCSPSLARDLLRRGQEDARYRNVEIVEGE